MDGSKRAVLVAALSTYADLLAKNTELLDLELGKGKSKASDDDVDLKEENQNQIKLCVELAERLTNASSGNELARIFEPEQVSSNLGMSDGELLEGLEKQVNPAKAAPSPSFSILQQSFVVDDEPCIDPFTGLPAIRETGYEAGPSSRLAIPLREPPRPQSLPKIVTKRRPCIPAEPIREPPKLPSPISRPPPLPTERNRPPPLRPPPKPPQLRASAIAPPKSTLIQSATLPQRQVPPQTPITAPEPQQLQQILTTPATQLKNSITNTTRAVEETVDTERLTDISSPQSLYAVTNKSPASSTQQQPVLLFLFQRESDIQEKGPGVANVGGHLPNNVHKNKFVNYIAELSSKLQKTNGRAATATTDPINQPQSLGQSVVVGVPLDLSAPPADHNLVPENATGYVSAQPQIGSPTRRISEESPPPAYDTLSFASRRSSLASMISGVSDSIWTSSSTLSSRAAASPLSTYSTISSPGVENRHQGIRAASPTTVSANSSSPNLQKRRHSIYNPPTITSPKRSFSSPFSLNGTPGVRKGGPPTSFSKSRSIQTGQPSLTSPRAKFGTFAVDQDDFVPSPAPMSPIIKPSSSQQTGFAHKPQSNNPWKDHMAADEAYARKLMQEEYQELALERELQLEYLNKNGTAVKEDFDLANLLFREAEMVMASTDSSTPALFALGTSADANFDTWGLDDDELKMQIDWLKAREIAKEDELKCAADDSDFAEAKRLQAQFDKEVQDEEAWEEWKKGNIEECLICVAEHHREELNWPCEHGYCNECLQMGFKNALDSKIPFKCCKRALSIETCPGLSPEFIENYENMMLELSTRNPMYCCNTKCAKFVPPRSIVGDIGTCEKCGSTTCRHCRRRTHPGTFCAEDKETKAVKELAKQKGWKTCPGCNHLIERSVGCLHMVCSRCQTAFCYRCSKRWNECLSTCPDPISATHPKY